MSKPMQHIHVFKDLEVKCGELAVMEFFQSCCTNLSTLPIVKILSVKNARAWVSIVFT